VRYKKLKDQLTEKSCEKFCRGGLHRPVSCENIKTKCHPEWTTAVKLKAIPLSGKSTL
jgi:hypothetical protein